MKKLALSVQAGLGFATAAAAADLPARYAPPPYYAPPIFSWAGFYIGINGGYAFGGGDTGSLASFGGNSLTGIDANQPGGPAPPVAPFPRRLGAELDGGFGGAQIGYNWQSGWLVTGVEADIQGASIEDKGAIVLAPPPGVASTTTFKSDLNWFSTVRARIGVANDRVLFYATAGAAVADYEHTVTFAAPGGAPAGFSLAGRSSGLRSGWTAGAGVEWAFLPNWSLKAEYLYVDFDRSRVTLTNPAFAFDYLVYRFEEREHLFRVGLNYRFSYAPPPAPVVTKY
jgi:outer membrane immunogenic protein